MKIGVVGGGAVGLLVASLLLVDEHDVTVYVKRNIQKELLRKEGLHLEALDGKIKIKAELFEKIGEMDLLIICVKQHQLGTVYPLLKEKESPLLFLQNGMGHSDALKKLDYSAPVLLGAVEHGAFRESDNQVVHTGKGKIRVAGFNQPGISYLSDIASLNSDHFPIQLEEDWRQVLLNKLVINAVINPLTALFDVKNGAILENDWLYRMASILTEEICCILEFDFDEHWERIKDVCKLTAGNSSSMRRDIKAGRETEIESISGYLVEQSPDNKKGYLHFTYHAIKALEKKSSKSDS